jgi:opacity protein-like surface antigen
MKKQLRAALALAAIGAAAQMTPALAADYEPPLAIDEAPEYVPVEVGSGWYLRGDLAYLPKDSYRHVDFSSAGSSVSQRERPVFASIGFGYHFNDYLRGDVNLGFLPGNKADIATSNPGVGTGAANVDNRGATAMVNGYVDLGTYVGITPYVGAGIGVFRSRYGYDVDYTDLGGGGGDVSASGRKTQYSFAYTLDAGIAYQISKNLMLDLGYQYLSAPDAEYASIDSPSTYSIRKGIDSHQIKLGLRYDLW